jgi:SPP1 family predicted phage head-tail adaptor
VSVRAGTYRERAAIQELTRTRDNQGGWADSWATISNGTVWARISPLSGAVELHGQGQKQVGRYEVEIRYRSGLTINHRILWGSRVLRITGITDPKSMHEKLLLTCEELPSAST